MKKMLKQNKTNNPTEQYCIELTGNRTGLYGDCSGLYGDCTALTGNCTELYGNCTGLTGNLDICQITEKNRKDRIDITKLAK